MTFSPSQTDISPVFSDEFWMRHALDEARLCLRTDATFTDSARASNVISVDSSTRDSANSPAAMDSGEGYSVRENAEIRGDNRFSDDVPVGAICVRENQIIARGHNRREIDRDPTAHAEALAIRGAARVLDNWRLDGVTLYVTLEPCAMCAGAIWLSRLERVVFGAWDERAGACGSILDIARDPRLNHTPQLRGGVLENECKAILQEFFAQRR